MADAPDNTQSRILQALTPAEMATFIQAAHKTQGSEGFARILQQLTPDCGKVLDQIFSAAPGQDAVTAASLQKQRAQWEGYTKAWNKLIGKAQSEQSAYWIQDQHWEPPYFDTHSFLDDLLEVLQQMAPLRQTAIAHGFKGLPDFPADLGNIHTAIEDGTPDWSYFEDGLDLNRAFTTEVLAWSWARARNRAQSPAEFLEAFYPVDLELRDRYIELDAAGFTDFFASLAAEEQAQLFACLEHHREDWADELEDLHSPWHALYMQLLQQQKPEAFLEAQEALIGTDWRQGAEVIRLWCERSAFAKAWELVQASFEALVEQRNLGADWAAETSLLARCKELHVGDREAAAELLELSLQIAGALQLTELVPVLEIQLQALDLDAGWEPVLELFRSRKLAPESRRCLFADWRSLTAIQALWLSASGEWWLHWLLDAALAGDEKKAFKARLHGWLDSLDGQQLAQPPLLLLTRDLLEIHRRDKDFPGLFEQTGQHLHLRMSRQDRSDRQRYLKQVSDESDLDRVLALWRRYGHLCVPDPARAGGSQYEDHAAWLKALQEVGSEHFLQLLENWKLVHHRRRNLWKALAALGIN